MCLETGDGFPAFPRPRLARSVLCWNGEMEMFEIWSFPTGATLGVTKILTDIQMISARWLMTGLSQGLINYFINTPTEYPRLPRSSLHVPRTYGSFPNHKTSRNDNWTMYLRDSRHLLIEDDIWNILTKDYLVGAFSFNYIDIFHICIRYCFAYLYIADDF